MTLWGSVIDASKPVKTYDVPLGEDLLPPASTEGDDAPTSTIPTPAPSTSKTIPKPTEHLPGDHGESAGEANKPAFPGSQQNSSKPVDDAADPSASVPAETASNMPTPDEGWFSDLSNLVSNKLWFFIAIGAVALFAIAAGVFFWIRAARRRANYASLPASDDVAMSSIARGARGSQRTKELYDAFGEVSDDEDADEETALRPHGPSPAVNLHSGFLDDDPSTAGEATPIHYKDEPEKDRSQSPGSASGSGDGSWEHASQTR